MGSRTLVVSHGHTSDGRATIVVELSNFSHANDLNLCLSDFVIALWHRLHNTVGCSMHPYGRSPLKYGLDLIHYCTDDAVVAQPPPPLLPDLHRLLGQLASVYPTLFKLWRNDDRSFHTSCAKMAITVCIACGKWKHISIYTLWLDNHSRHRDGGDSQ